MMAHCRADGTGVAEVGGARENGRRRKDVSGT